MDMPGKVPMPVLPGERAQARALALSTRDTVRVVHEEVRRIVLKARGNRASAFRLGIQRLRQEGLATDRDAARLTQILSLLPIQDPRQGADEDPLPRVRAIYEEMIADWQSTPTARSIVSAVVGALESEEVSSSGAAVARRVSPATAGMVIGAAIGGFLGGLFGGPLGAAVGAEVGGAAGGGYGSCFD
jgi:hypothetical protein